MRGSTGGNEGKQGRKGGTERKGGSAEERKGASEEIGRGREQGVSMGERGEKRGSKGKKEGKQGGNGREGGGERRGSMGGKEAKEGGKGGETGAERRGSKGGTEGKQGRKGGGAERERRGSRGKGGEAVEKRRGSRGGKGGELGGEGRGSMGGKGGEARVEMRRRKGGKEGNQGNSRLIPFRASSPSSSSPSAPHPLPPLIPFRASSISVPHPLPRIINFPLSVSSARLCDKERKRANAPAADHVTSGASLLSRAKAPFFSPPFPIPPPVSAPLLHRLALRLPQVAPADSSPIARSEPISPADAVFFPPLPSLSAFHNADLEGGNMRHIGSISNPCLTKRPFLQRAYQEPPPVSGAPIGQHRFVMAGGYRIGANQFAAVGHSLRDLKEEGGSGASKCYWIALDGGYAEGRVRVIYPAEHHWLLYETAIYECTLLVNSTGTTGGSAILMLDEQAVVMHEEGQDEFAIDAPPPYHLAFCSYPMYRHLNPKTIQEWLQIALHYLGVEYFVLNDGASIVEDVYEVLEPYMAAGMMEILDMRGGYKYESKQNVLVLNNCLYRMKFVSKWVFFADFDEFLYIQPPQTLKGLLHEHSNAPYITFGSLWWSIERCR
ncbi:unnamed protein product, partial [Closterium sp. NIES-64]